MNYAPVTILIATALVAGLMALRFNLKTYSLVRQIQGVAAREGAEWAFYGDSQRTFAFLMRPGKLIDLSDSVALRASKQTLLEHRKHLRRTLLTAWAIMIAGFLLAAGIPLSYAFLHRH